ncbi:MAG: S8 family peptidase [Clostridium sp.]|nr:S8 family peptidase [Clostridium sp.]
MDNTQFNASTCENAVYSEDYIPLLIDYGGDFKQVIDRFNPTCYIILNIRQAIIYVYIGNIPISIDKYEYRTVPKLFGLMDTAVLEETGVQQIRRQPYIDLYGQDVIIGFIDTGIDYRNPVFQNADGTSRILSIWDQTIRTGPNPVGQNYGTEYKKEQIDLALQNEDPLSIVPSVDTNGHGTFMAGVAAGNIDEANDFSGIAPNCDIVMVKLRQARNKLKSFWLVKDDVDCYEENDILAGLAFLLDKAEEMSKPIVICIGIGTNSGDHNGNSPLGQFIDYSGFYTGVGFVCGTGNEGNRAHHYQSGQVAQGASEELEINVGEDENGFVVELWASTPALFAIGLTSPSGEVITEIQPRIGKVETVKFVLEKTVVSIAYFLVEPGSGDYLVFLRFDRPAKGIWKIRAFNRSPGTSSFNMWLPITQFIQDSTYFNRSEPDITITEPGNCSFTTTTSLYNSMTDSMYIHSGRGFTRNGRIQPTIAAPGVSVYGPGLNNQFVRNTGSSVAAAVAGGIAAMVMEWAIVQQNDTDLNSNSLREYLIIGAKERDISYPNREWGYGEINIFEIFEKLGS